MPDSISAALSVLDNGERQVAPTIDGIRADHVARYRWASETISQSQRVIDVGCGVGYGAKLLADNGVYVVALDRSPEATLYGERHYADDRVIRLCCDAWDIEHISYPFDTAICFEILEHLENPVVVLKALATKCTTLYASVPNEDGFPFNNRIAFHYRHYTKRDFETLLACGGWCVEEFLAQEGIDSSVGPYKKEARTLVVKARRLETFDVVDIPSTEVEQQPQRHIAIVGLGASIIDYVDISRRLGGRSAIFDEVWVINTLGNVLDCDLIIHMDDVRVQEARIAERNDQQQRQIRAMLEWMKRSDGPPIITSRAHPDYPRLVEFPLQDVLNDLGQPYFNSTSAYAIALAIHRRATAISIFGIDFTYPDRHFAEKGRACVEYWLGVAQERGIMVTVGSHSTLMDACEPQALRLYGYDTVDVAFNATENGVEVTFTEKEVLPSAAEIEARYDHSAHPNALMRAVEAP